MAFKYNDAQKETGNDVMLNIGGDGAEIPITNVSFSEETETSEVQFSTGFSQNIAVTGVSYSGSFETAGRNNSLRDQLWDKGNTGNPALPRYVNNITIVDGGGREYVFQNVVITSHSKDVPSDDRATESYDFSAEKLFVNDGGPTGHTTG